MPSRQDVNVALLRYYSKQLGSQPPNIDALKPQDKVRQRYQEEGSELDHQGIFTYCINLDAAADAYVADIFGKRYTVIDNIARLPERLPKLFMALTR